MRKKQIVDYFADKSVGVVFSGGGARGFAHLGVMQYFVEVGITPQFFAGNSAGALVAVCLAAGKTPQETVDHFLSHNLLRSAFKLSMKGILDAKVIAKEVLDFAGVKSFSELKIPLKVNAMDINTGKEQVFSDGELASALQATISLPLVFFPAKIGDNYYIDGSAVDVVPYHLLPDLQIKVAIDISLEPAKITYNSNQLNVFSNTLLFAQKKGFTKTHLAKEDMYIRLKLPSFSLLERSPTKHRELFELGYNRAKKDLNKYFEKIKL